MKVYLVISDWATEIDGSDFNIEVFGTYEEAKEEFDKVVADEKENDCLMESSCCQMEETENQFEIWEDGYYASNHFRISIVQKEINTNKGGEEECMDCYLQY